MSYQRRKYKTPLEPPTRPSEDASADEKRRYELELRRYNKLQYGRDYYYAHRTKRREETMTLSKEISEMKAMVASQKELIDKLMALKCQ